MEFPIELNSSWISTFKNLNADFENVYKRDYLPDQIYNFNAIIEHESSLKNNSNSNIQVNNDNKTKFVDNLHSWTLRNSDSNNICDDNGYDCEKSSSSIDENSLKIVSNDNLNIQETSTETINQNSNNCDSRFEIDSENEIEPEISITFENNLKFENLQTYSLETSDSENESLKFEESFIKDTSNLLLQSDAKNLSNDINEPLNDFLNDLSHNKYSTNKDTTISNKDVQTKNYEIEDQLCDQIIMSNENLEKIENCNLECENGNLDSVDTSNEIHDVNTNNRNIIDVEYLKENINTPDENKNITYQNNNNHDEIHPIKMEIKTPEFIHQQPKLIDEKQIDFSTTNESDKFVHDNNINETVKPMNNEVLDLKKELKNPNDEFVETEIFETISPSTSNQKSMDNSKESFETNLDQVKNHFENYLTDDNYVNIDDLNRSQQNSIVDDVSQEIHHSNNNIKIDNDACVKDENKKYVDRDDYNIENTNKLKEKLHSPDNFFENNLNKSDLNDKKYDNKINEKRPDSVIRDNSNFFLEEEITELKIEKDSCFERDFMSQEIDISNKENEIDILNTENINDDSFSIYNSPKSLKNSDNSVLRNDFCTEMILSKTDNNETVIYKPILDEIQKDEISINENNYEFSGNLKYENLVHENIKNSFTNPKEFNNETNESFKTNPSYFKEMDGDISPYVQIPEEKKYSFLDDTLQNSDSFNNEIENSLKVNYTDKEPVEMKTNLLGHPKSVNNKVKYEFDNSNCNFESKPDQNLTGNVSKNNWKEYSSSPKKSYEKDVNENQESFEYKNRFNDNYEKKIQLKSNDNSFSTKKHEKPYKESSTNFTVNNDNQLRSINNFPKYKDVDYNGIDDINTYVSPSIRLLDSSALKSDLEKNFNVNYSNNYVESDNRKSLNNKINAYKMSDKLNIRKPVCHSLEDKVSDDGKSMKTNSTILKLPNFKSDMIITSHKMRNNSDTYDILKHNPDSSYNYDSTNLSSKGKFKNSYFPSSQNVLPNNQINYSNNLSNSMFPYKNKNESTLVNENVKDKNTSINNMNKMNLFPVNTKTPSKYQGIYDSNQKMIEENNDSNINANDKPFCKKCMRFHFPTTSFDSRNYNNISKPYMGNKNLKSFNSSNLPKKIITRENSFGKRKFVSNINTEPSFSSKCYSKKYNMPKNDVDLNTSVNSNCNFISDVDPTLELRVYCRGRLIYEPLF